MRYASRRSVAKAILVSVSFLFKIVVLVYGLPIELILFDGKNGAGNVPHLSLRQEDTAEPTCRDQTTMKLQGLDRHALGGLKTHF